MTKNKEWPDGRHTLGGRFLVTVSQSSGDSRAGRGGAPGGQLPLPRRRGDAREVSGKNSNSAEATKPMWGAWLWGFGACLWRELPLTSNPFP